MKEEAMHEVLTSDLTAEEIRSELAAAGLDVTEATWPCSVIVAGRVYRPMLEAGVMLVDGKPEYSAAWL